MSAIKNINNTVCILELLLTLLIWTFEL